MPSEPTNTPQLDVVEAIDVMVAEQMVEIHIKKRESENQGLYIFSESTLCFVCVWFIIKIIILDIQY